MACSAPRRLPAFFEERVETLVLTRTSGTASQLDALLSRFPNVTVLTEWPDEALETLKPDRATAILAEAVRMLPADGRLRGAYAASLKESGDTKKALAAYKQWGLTGASVDDYSTAIGTAMAERSDLAAKWLDDAMKRFPSEPKVLGLAADIYAQKGDFARAEMYYRSALAVAGRKPKAEKATSPAKGKGKAKG